MSKTTTLVLRIVAIVLTAIAIAQKLYFTINIFREDLLAAKHVAVYYILEILALAAVIVGLAMCRYLISNIGFICYYVFTMILTVSQFSSAGSTIIFTDLFYLLVGTVIIAMIALVMSNMIKAWIPAIVIGATVILDAVIYILQMLLLPGLRLFSISTVRDLFVIMALGVAIVCTCLLTGNKDSENSVNK